MHQSGGNANRRLVDHRFAWIYPFVFVWEQFFVMRDVSGNGCHCQTCPFRDQISYSGGTELSAFRLNMVDGHGNNSLIMEAGQKKVPPQKISGCHAHAMESFGSFRTQRRAMARFCSKTSRFP
jgi:hypothetical protein